MNSFYKEILKDCEYPKEIESLLNQAEIVFKTWQPLYSDFLSAPIIEEAMKILASLNDVDSISDGGYPSAERQRIKFIRSNYFEESVSNEIPLNGIRIEGNFLFDNASCEDFRKALIKLGAKEQHLGDIFIYQDRGAEIICTPEAAFLLDEKTSAIREVRIKCESINIKEVKFPNKRIPKRFTSIEASKRIDAIASAGFGLSRAKIIKAIKEELLRLNWKKVTQASQELNSGDKIQLENKGGIEILSLNLTKKQRWRVELLRK